MDVPFAADTAHAAYLAEMKALFARHPNTTIIWAHTGLGPRRAPGASGTRR